GRPHATDRLFLVNGEENTLIDCADAGLPYFARLVADVHDRTETAISQSDTFLASELAIRAQIKAETV
ncbi:MAG: gfo/Idh/MocA family oxidoreductase, partial [Pseudomonadota bacterium]